MKPNWLISFAQYLDKMAPILSLDGSGQSRKVEGWFNGSKEIRCYSRLHYYVQDGLGAHDRLIAKVIDVVHHFQEDNGRGNYEVSLYRFGDEATSRFSRRGCYTGVAATARQLCQAAGTTDATKAPVILMTGTMEDEDFQVFFCNDRSVKLDRSIARRYAKTMKRCAWFFLEGDEPSWEPGSKFKPELVDVVIASPD